MMGPIMEPALDPVKLQNFMGLRAGMLALMMCNRSSWRYVPMLPRTRSCRCIRLSSSRHRTKVFTDFGLPVKGFSNSTW